MKKKAGRKIQVIYMGKRQMSDGTICQAFLYGKRELFWSRIRANVIGGIYIAEHFGKKQGIRMSRRPSWQGMAEGLTEGKVEAWEAQHESLMSERKKASAERRAGKNTKLREIAKQLAPMIRGLGYLNTRGLVEALIDQAESFSRKKAA